MRKTGNENNKSKRVVVTLKRGHDIACPPIFPTRKGTLCCPTNWSFDILQDHIFKSSFILLTPAIEADPRSIAVTSIQSRLSSKRTIVVVIGLVQVHPEYQKVYRYSIKKFKKMLVKYEAWGPWELKAPR